MDPAVAVMTVTRRLETLERCLDSVQQQSYDGPLVHELVVDDNESIDAYLTSRTVDSRVPIRWQVIRRNDDDVDGPARLAVLRNLAVQTAQTDYVAFLDDDNRWEPGHLASLWKTMAAHDVDIAHSERRLFHNDGSPYLTPEFPWGRDELTRRAIYAYCQVAGIMEPDSNVVHDRFEMRFTWIDLGEWLFPREFLRANPFETHYSLWDWYNINVEDQSLPRAVFESGLRIASTNEPTLHYYLGGYTTTFEGDGVVWRRPAPADGHRSGAEPSPA